MINKWRQLPYVSGVLVIINIVLYIVCLFDGGNLYRSGSLDAYKVLVDNEYQRILTATFLHGSTEHLFNNMIILFALGAMVEKEVGHFWYGILYFAGGIGGNLLSLYVKVLRDDMAVSIGASGAVFGLNGMFLAMILFSGKKLTNVTSGRVVAMVLFSLYIGFRSTNVDNAAHVGGLLVGFLFGCLLCFVRRLRQKI